MFDIGWTELMLIGVVALIVVGPKELPGMFRTVGRYVGKARGMARDFQRAMETAADESGIKDAAKGMSDLADIGNIGSPNLKGMKAAKERYEKIVQAKETGVPLKEGDIEPEPKRKDNSWEEVKPETADTGATESELAENPPHNGEDTGEEPKK